MFANAEMQIASAGRLRLKVASVREGKTRLGGRRQVGRTTNQPRMTLRDCIEDLARRLASGETFGVGREGWQVRVPSGRQIAPLHPIDLVGELRVLSPV